MEAAEWQRLARSWRRLGSWAAGTCPPQCACPALQLQSWRAGVLLTHACCRTLRLPPAPPECGRTGRCRTGGNPHAACASSFRPGSAARSEGATSSEALQL